MKTLRAFFTTSAIALLLYSCVSGKGALKQGDYYDAVIESVNRLRSSPNNKKSIQVLTQAYPLCIDYIESGIQDGLKSDDNKKWRKAVAGYEKINFINNQIKTSIGASKIITNPQTRFTELANAKEKAADEAYNEGINFMMKSSREDYKQAYYDFKDANDFKQGYKESIEMMTQAEFKATIRVAYEEINNSNINYGSFQPTINSLQRLFLSIKPAGQKDTVPPHQYLTVRFNGFQVNRPSVSTRNENIPRQIKVGEQKGADGKMQDVLQTVSADVTYFHKTITADAYASVTITDAATNSILQNLNVSGPVNWTSDWATYRGDGRALNGTSAALVQRRETFPNDQEIFNQAIRNLQGNLNQQLKSFYSQY
ncbi:MAG TPA: hypothetical protein DGG95_03165 [Cytophagales bacterium]|jgi:hypothetical protein|nr:hypothetical protein [Cytophagales bacterium]